MSSISEGTFSTGSVEAITSYDDTITPSEANFETNPTTLTANLNSLEANFETNPTTLTANLNSLHSAIKAISGESDWWQPITTDLLTLSQQKVIQGVHVLTNVTVGAGENWVVLSASGSETPSDTAAIGTGTGAIVAVLAGDVGAHALDEIAGSNALRPKNLCKVRDASTKDIISSATGQEIFALLQAESGTLQGEAFDDTTKQVQLSFVVQSGDDLVAANTADIGSKTIEYMYPKRTTLDSLPEDATFPLISFVDQSVINNVTLNNVIDNQSTTPATQSTDIDVDMDAATEWAWRDAASADLIVIKEGSGGGTSEFQIGAAVDVFNNDAISNLFASTINTPGLVAPADLTLDDGNRGASTFSAALKLADTSAEWDSFETNFGEVSVLNAITQANVAADAAQTDLDTLEAKTLIVPTEVLGNVVVGGSDNWVVLTGATITNTAGVSGGLGAVVAVLAGDVGAHALTEEVGANGLRPKNLVYIRDAATSDAITSGGQQIFGLLQAESGVIQGDTFDDTTKQIQISFVIRSGDDLIACPAGDIQGKTIEYLYPTRIDLSTLDEDALYAVLGGNTDSLALVDSTLTTILANQGATVAEAAANTTIDLGAGIAWAWRDAANAALVTLTEGSGGGTTTLAISGDVDTFDNDAVTNDFANGLSVATTGQKINIGTTAGTIESDTAEDLTILGTRELFLDDGNQIGSTWAQTGGIKLSETTAEWDSFETAFGEVSLLNAIEQASTTGSGIPVYDATVGASGDYADVNAAIAAGKVNVLIIEDVTEDSDVTILAEDTAITLANNVTWTTGTYDIKMGAFTRLSLWGHSMDSSIIVRTNTTDGDAFIDGGAGDTVTGGNFQFDNSGSNQTGYFNGNGMAGRLTNVWFKAPNNNGGGFEFTGAGTLLTGIHLTGGGSSCGTNVFVLRDGGSINGLYLDGTWKGGTAWLLLEDDAGSRCTRCCSGWGV
jgi:hypothetical protein